MTKHTPGPQDDGGLYVYIGEDGKAIAVAMNGRGPNGGWQGIQVAKMALPKDQLSREQINQFAAMFAAAPELLEALQVALSYAGTGDDWVSQARKAISNAKGIK